MDRNTDNKQGAGPDVLELDADQAEITSACMSCGGTGITRMLLTKIPHFNDIVVMSFECNDCPYKDNEIQNISSLRDYGVKLEVQIMDSKGLNNQVVVSNTSSIKLIDIDFEIPKIDRKGIITTLEGLIVNVINNLDEHIVSICDEITRNDGLRIELSTGELKPATDYISQLTQIKDTLLKYSQGLEIFNVEIDDPSGNSYIEENEHVQIKTHKYERTNNQLKDMGYMCNSEQDEKQEQGGTNGKEWDLNKPLEDHEVGEENLRLVVNCPNCGKQGFNEICQVSVPGFGKSIIMSFLCEFCGAKTNEMKPGGGYKPFGKRWTLKVESDRDLNRDVIISETATVLIEHLQFEMTPGTIGSAFTSVEGLIKKIVESLETSYPFLIGDSAESTNTEVKDTVRNLNSLTDTLNFKLVIDDPIDHSFISSISPPDAKYPNLPGNLVNGDNSLSDSDRNPSDEPESEKLSQPGSVTQVDDNLSFVLYERTFEQNEELGLNDLNTQP